MAKLTEPLTEEQVKSTPVAELRKKYNIMARDFSRIKNGKWYYCHACDEFHPVDCFYSDKRYASGLFPECSKALLLQATDYDKKTNTYVDNKEKTKAVFKKLNLPFIDSLYKSALTSVNAAVGEKNRSTAFQQILVMTKSLHQYRDKTWADSVFDDEETDEDVPQITRRVRKEIYKIFGGGFSHEDYVYLQDQYDDWRSRTQVDSKSQETYVIQICLQLLDIFKDRKQGKDVSNKLKALDTLMNAANLQPKQNVGNAATDSLTFGQMIEKWEMEKPVPEPSEEFKDVDGIGKYIRVWFAGHLSKALGLKTAYTEEYDEYIKQYTVNKYESSDDGDESSDDLYNQIFGSSGD